MNILITKCANIEILSELILKGSREEIESWEAQFKLSSKILKEKFLQPDAIISFAPLRKLTQTRWLLCGQGWDSNFFSEKTSFLKNAFFWNSREKVLI